MFKKPNKSYKKKTSFFKKIQDKISSYFSFEDKSIVLSGPSKNKSFVFKKEYQIFLYFICSISLLLFSTRIYFYSQNTESIKYLEKENKKLKQINNNLIKKLEKASLDFEKFNSYFEELKKIDTKSLNAVEYKMYDKYLLSYKRYLNKNKSSFSGLNIKKINNVDVADVMFNVEDVLIKIDNLISECFNKINLRFSSLIEKVSFINLFETGDKMKITKHINQNQKIKKLNTLNKYYYDKKKSLNQGGPLAFYLEYKDSFLLNASSLSDNLDLDFSIENKESMIKKVTDISSNFLKNILILEDIAFSIPKMYPMKKFIITSKFGIRKDPFTKNIASHGGVDFFSKEDSDILAVNDGVVIRSGVSDSYGEVIEVRHGNHLTTRYAHLSKRNVKIGDMVNAGQVIGKQGDTGRAHGAHLHFEILLNNTRTDPLFYFNKF